MRSKSAFTLLLIACMLFTRCDDEADTPLESRDLFTLTTPSDFNTADTDNWVIASDEQGKVIAWQPFETGDEVMLAGDVKQGSTSFTVTLLTYYTVSEAVKIESFADIPIGSQWTIPDEPTGNSFPVGGYISFQLTGFPLSSIPNYIVSSLDGPVLPGFITGNPGKYSIPKSPCHVFFHMLPYYEGAVPKYGMIDNITAGGTADVNFNTLLEYDHLFTVNTIEQTQYRATVSGYNTSVKELIDYNRHVLSHFESSSYPPPQFMVTYNDGYTFYKTEWLITSIFDESIYYEKIGGSPTPDNFILPEFDVTIVNNKLNDFRINSETQFEFSSEIWRPASGTLVWYVKRPATGHPVVVKFPDELISSYGLTAERLNDLRLTQSTFYEVKSGFTYENYLLKTYHPTAFQHQEWEYYTFERKE